MPKSEKGEPAKGKPPPAPRPPAKKLEPEERLEDLQQKLARLNREAESLSEAMRPKPKK